VERDSRSSNCGGGGGPSTLPGVRPASILRLEPVSSTTPAFCSALRADGKTQREALAQALGAGGLPAPVALPVGRIRVASPALPPPSSILGGQSTMGRESSRVTGWAKKRSTPEPIHNRTDSIVPSSDRTASGITGDVALSVSPLLKAGFLYREIYSLRPLIIVLLEDFFLKDYPSTR
jgi:hypothetical protein